MVGREEAWLKGSQGSSTWGATELREALQVQSRAFFSLASPRAGINPDLKQVCQAKCFLAPPLPSSASICSKPNVFWEALSLKLVGLRLALMGSAAALFCYHPGGGGYSYKVICLCSGLIAHSLPRSSRYRTTPGFVLSLFSSMGNCQLERARRGFSLCQKRWELL